MTRRLTAWGIFAYIIAVFIDSTAVMRVTVEVFAAIFYGCVGGFYGFWIGGFVALMIIMCLGLPLLLLAAMFGVDIQGEPFRPYAEPSRPIQYAALLFDVYEGFVDTQPDRKAELQGRGRVETSMNILMVIIWVLAQVCFLIFFIGGVIAGMAGNWHWSFDFLIESLAFISNIATDP